MVLPAAAPARQTIAERGAISGVSPAPASAIETPIATELPEEERRLVTALFCDLVGFTPLSA